MTREEMAEYLEALDSLEKNVAWQQFAGELRGRAEAAAANHEDVTLPAERRAEHLHAMKILRDLAGNGTAAWPGWLNGERLDMKARLAPANVLSQRR